MGPERQRYEKQQVRQRQVEEAHVHHVQFLEVFGKDTQHQAISNEAHNEDYGVQGREEDLAKVSYNTVVAGCFITTVIAVTAIVFCCLENKQANK